MNSGIFASRKTLIAAGVFAAGMAGLATADAASPARQYFVFGTGSGYQTFLTPCPDIPCNNGAQCSCIYSTGTFQSKPLGAGGSSTLSYTLEVSADNSTQFGNGSGGSCYGNTGLMTLTATDGSSLDIDFGGAGCRINKRKSADVLFGITAPGTIVGSTGRFVNATGAGSVSLILNQTTSTVNGDISGNFTNNTP